MYCAPKKVPYVVVFADTKRRAQPHLRPMQQHEQYKQKSKYFWFYTIAVFAIATLALVLFTTRGGTQEVGTSDRPAASVTAADLPPTLGSGAVSPPGQPVPGSGIVPGRKDDTEGTRPSQ